MDGSIEPDGGETEPKCNGHAELCERRYDEVSYPMTHNAMSNAAAGWGVPNQNQLFYRERSHDHGVARIQYDAA